MAMSRRKFIKYAATGTAGAYFAGPTIGFAIEGGKKVYNIGKYFSNLSLSREDPVTRYLSIMPKEFQEKYSAAVPKNLESIRMAIGGIADTTGSIAYDMGKDDKGPLDGLSGLAVKIHKGVKKLIRRDGTKVDKTATKEYAENYNRTVKVFQAGIGKLVELDKEIRAQSNLLREIEEKEGPSTRKFYKELEKMIDLANEKIGLYDFLRKLPQNINAAGSLNVEEISQGRRNPRYESIVFQEAARHNLEKYGGGRTINQVEGHLLGAMLAIYASESLPIVKEVTDSAAAVADKLLPKQKTENKKNDSYTQKAGRYVGRNLARVAHNLDKATDKAAKKAGRYVGYHGAKMLKSAADELKENVKKIKRKIKKAD